MVSPFACDTGVDSRIYQAKHAQRGGGEAQGGIDLPASRHPLFYWVLCENCCVKKVRWMDC